MVDQGRGSHGRGNHGGGNHGSEKASIRVGFLGKMESRGIGWY